VAAMSVKLARLEGRSPALEHLRAVTAVLLEQPASASSVSLLCQLAIVDGDPAFALPVLDELAALARAEGRAEPAQAALARATVWFLAGHLDEATAALAAAPADGTGAVEQLALTASLALARGTPRLAIEPVLMAAALGESREQAVHTAAAWHLAAEVYRRVGLVDRAREAREQAATLYRRSGLKRGLAELEVERAWEALTEGRDDEAAEVLAPLASVSEPKVAAQAALATAALAARRGRPGDALPAVLAAHDRLIERGAQLLAVPLARAAQILSGSAGRTLPARISATLAWAAERQLPEVDVLYIPSPYTGDTEETNTPS
jgi:tetratricopeptide (TPR) repeat protein